MAGLWKPALATNGPSSTLLVTAASAERVDTIRKTRVVALDLRIAIQEVIANQIESSPISSAVFAISTICGHVYSIQLWQLNADFERPNHLSTSIRTIETLARSLQRHGGLRFMAVRETGIDRRRLLAAAGGLALAARFHTASAQTIPWPTREWSVVDPAAVGLSAAQLELTDQRIRDAYPDITGVGVVRGGALAFERYYGSEYGQNNPVDIRSITRASPDADRHRHQDGFDPRSQLGDVIPTASRPPPSITEASRSRIC